MPRPHHSNEILRVLFRSKGLVIVRLRTLQHRMVFDFVAIHDS